MTIYNLGNIKGEKGDKGDSITGPTGPVGVGIKSIEQITHKKFKFCLTDGSEYIIDYDTGSFDGMVVACDKSILSAADGEFATVSAQLTNGGFPVPFAGELVTFEVRKQSDDSLVETLSDTTDGTGKASVEYFGRGVGDLNISVRCRSQSETYEVQDLIFYDSATSDKSSEYNTRLVSSITHNTNYYQVVTSSTSSLSNYMSTVLVKDLVNIPQHFKVVCDINLPNLQTTSGTDEIGLGIFTTNGQSNNEEMIDLMSNQLQKGLIARNPWGDNRVNGKLSDDVWYTFELEYDGSVATGTIYNGNSTIWTGTLSSTKTINYIGLCELGKNSGYKFKNLKIKPL